MSQKVYPYQNISLENLEGEVWKDVPGLDGYFLISKTCGNEERVDVNELRQDKRKTN